MLKNQINMNLRSTKFYTDFQTLRKNNKKAIILSKVSQSVCNLNMLSNNSC